MLRKPFQFKQFAVFQDKTAMKVGTDGVLLGAWTKVDHAISALDIGTGTGLVALMLAQRNHQLLIDAIELDAEAYEQAIENTSISRFNEQIKVIHTALQEFDFNKTYDLIVSNPPFFQVNDRVEGSARKNARQQDSLSFDTLLERTALMLSPEGTACFIIPSDTRTHFLYLAALNKLFAGRVCSVRGHQDSPIKRCLIELTFKQPEIIIEEELIIEEARHQYTAAYQALCCDFYLKMENKNPE